MSRFLTLAAAATLFLCSCAKEQSEMSINDIKGHAKVIGQIYYSAGTDYKNGAFSELVTPAENVKVAVKITNQSLTDKAVDGYTVFETTTDKRGMYEITIPADATGVTISLKPDDFIGTRKVISIDNGSVKTVNEEVIFYAQEKDLGTVKPGEIVSGNILYGFKEISTDYEFPEVLDFRVTVYKNAYDESGKVTFDVARAVSLYLTVKYDSNTERTYALTTNASGIAEFKIPSKTAAWSGTFTLRAEPYLGNFTYFKSHYNDYGEPTESISFLMNGYYQSYYQSSYTNYFNQERTVSVSFTGLPGTYKSIDQLMIFTPFEGETDDPNINYNYNSNWQNYFQNYK